MPPEEFQLPEKDVRAIMRLLGEVIAMPGDIHVCRRRLMDGLCPIIGADAWLWCMAGIEKGKTINYAGFIHGGFEDDEFTAFLEASHHPALALANQRISDELVEKRCHLTRSRAQLEVEDHPIFARDLCPLWDKANIGTLMLSLRPMEDESSIGSYINTSGVGFYRRRGKPDFDVRQARIAHIVLTEVPWLHYREFPDSDKIARLFPRHRTILNLLGEGWSRKKIAGHLALSENTVHGYVKEIFKHFGAHSQAELIARFAKGDGGDR